MSNAAPLTETDTGWSTDVLGPGFEARTLPLLDDDEGPNLATLVRYLPFDDPEVLPGTPSRAKFAALWLHGWNDYFSQRELARVVARMGGAWYALDLRAYGRSLRDWQTRGFVTSLNTYDEDIHAALAVIRAEFGAGKLVLMGHSTGGLTAALWAHRHPDALSGLVLNSPWLELQGSALFRALGTQIVDQLSRLAPKSAIPVPDNGFYGRTLRGWNEEEDGPRPGGTEGDPFYDGWQLNPEWRVSPSPPIRPAWLSAIRAGQQQVAAGLDITCPVLVMSSTKTALTAKWDPELRGADTVLDVDLIAERTLRLGRQISLTRLEGAIHDVFLSQRAVREQAYAELERWMTAFVIAAPPSNG